MFEGLPRSTVLTHRGKTLRFPSLEDYRRWLIDHKVLGTEEDLATRGDLVTQIQVHWHKCGQTGCVFAKILSVDPTGNQWLLEPLTGIWKWSAAEWSARLGDRVRAAVANKDVWLLSLLLPDVTEPDHLRRLVAHLATLEGWSVVPSDPVDIAQRGLMVNLGLRLLLPGNVTSWALGLGPFAFLPFTRQSPFAELLLAVKPKGPNPIHPMLNPDPTLAHVADAPVPIVAATVPGIWSTTQANKKLLLRDVDDAGAKAKVTYSIPAGVWAAGVAADDGQAAEAARG